MAEWLTYERNGRSLITKLATEPPVRNGWKPRPASKEEIATEVRDRTNKGYELADRKRREARQDYQDAQAIKAMLEWECDKADFLNRLTPQEWSDLRKRLES